MLFVVTVSFLLSLLPAACPPSLPKPVRHVVYFMHIICLEEQCLPSFLFSVSKRNMICWQTYVRRTYKASQWGLQSLGNVSSPISTTSSCPSKILNRQQPASHHQQTVASMQQNVLKRDATARHSNTKMLWKKKKNSVQECLGMVVVEVVYMLYTEFENVML